MDILSLAKANKAKRAIKKVNERIGTGIGMSYGSAKKRIEFLESKDPKVNPSARVSALETNTAINLNKHNLRVNALLNHKRYNMKDMIVDDFGDATGIDVAQSVNLSHDVANHLVKQLDGTKEATFVSTVENLLTAPDYIMISSVLGNNSTSNKAFDITRGVFTDVVINSGKLELAKSKEGATDYKKTGAWLSEAIDMGDNFKRLMGISTTVNVPTETSLLVYTSTSADGVTYESFKPLNSDGTIASTSNRYIKIKLEFVGKPEVQAERNILDFVAADSSKFTASNFVTFDGALKVKTLFVTQMTKDATFTETGALMRAPLDRSLFKSINTIEVKGNA